MTDQRSFSSRVLSAVRSIPRGYVSTYGHIALMAGSPGAARQVGWVLAGLHPEADDVPWHRIINARGRISIRGRGDMAELQKRLLESEGIEFGENDAVDLETCLYTPE